MQSIRFDRPLYIKIQEQAKIEHRTFSEMIRYMATVYIRQQENDKIRGGS